VIASDQSRFRGSSGGAGPMLDQSPDQLFDQYVNACHQQTGSGSGTRSMLHDTSAGPEFSHYINSFRVISKSDIDGDGPNSSFA
jgi:hypothetical protein